MTELQIYVLLTILALLLAATSVVAVSLQRMLWRSNPRRQRVVLPMSSGVNVKPGSAMQVTGKPQDTAFRPERIVLGGHPDRWIVNDVKVGNTSQFAQSGDVPGEMFSASAIDCFLRMDPVRARQDFVIFATYIGPEADGEPFVCGVLGTSISEGEIGRARTIDRGRSIDEMVARQAA